MPKPPLTPRQEEVYKALILYVFHHGRSPIYAEIGEKLGICPETVRKHLGKIEAKGYITQQRWVWRGTKIVKDDDESAE